MDMIRHRRIGRLRRTLRVESLEERTLLSGLVTAVLGQTNGLLQIQGDAGSHGITITLSPTPGALRIAGVAGTFTAINGVTFTDFPLAAITGVSIALGDSQESVTMSGARIPGNLQIVSGNGANTFALTNFTANTVNITAGDGGNQVNLTGVTTGALNVLTGTMKDAVSLSTSTIGTAFINTGFGKADDQITVSGQTVGNLTLVAGDGANQIRVTGTRMGRATLVSGTGANTIVVNNNTFASSAAPATLLVDVGSFGGPDHVQSVTLADLVFETPAPNVPKDSSLLVSLGAAIPVDDKNGPSTFTLAGISGLDAAEVSIGENWDTVLLDTLSSRSLTVQVGDNTSNLQLNNLTVAGPIALSIGNLAQIVQLTNIVTTISSPVDLAQGRLADLDLQTGIGTLFVGLDTIQAGRNLTITADTGDTMFALANIDVGQNMTFTVGDGNNTIFLNTIQVLLELVFVGGFGFNGLSARDVTCAFGSIDGGFGPSNVYWDQGGNEGFAVSGFSGFLVGSNPPSLQDSDLSLSATTIQEGNSVTLSGTFLHPGNTDAHTVTIDWGDGSANTQLQLAPDVFSFSAPHQYLSDKPGGTPITITVTDSQSNSVSASTSVTVTNAPPVLPASSLQVSAAAITEGGSVALTGTFTDPGLADTHTVVINWGDGSTPTTLTLDAGVLTFGPISHTYLANSAGTYPIQVTVTDANLGSASASTQVTVQNAPPALPAGSLQVSAATITEGGSVALTGTFTDPGLADTHTVVINWGDGSANTTLSLGANLFAFSANHQYLDELPGNTPYTIRVTVTDQDNGSASASTFLTVTNLAPIAQAGPDQTVPEGTRVTLTGTFTDPGTLDGHTFNWTVVSTNGQVIPAGSGPSFTFTPNDDGTYTVTLTVTDSDGGVGTATTRVSVTRVPPTLTLSGAATVSEGSPYSLNLGSQDLGADTITSWTIAWGDGTVQTVLGRPSSVPHVYADGPRSYTITAQARDEDGTYDAPSPLAVQVVDVPPTLSLSGPASGTPSSPYTLQLSAVDPGADPITSWTITWGDGTVQTVDGTATTVAHTYARVDRYTISARATVEGETLNAGNTVTVSIGHASANENFVAQVYVDVLGRPVDPEGLRSWTGILETGGTRYQVTQGILTSLEYRTLVVEQLYHDYLGRAADPLGLSTYVQALFAGLSTDQIKASILASDEYFQGRGGATLDGFFSALYQDVLGRSSTPSENQIWIQAALSGAARSQLASLVLSSPEGNEFLVQRAFQQCLQRTADPYGLSSFVEARQRGATEQAILAVILASDEYFANSI